MSGTRFCHVTYAFVSSDDISKMITLLDTTKTGGVNPTKIVKVANKEICKDLANCINKSIKNNKFSNALKSSDITPKFKIEDSLNKENYRAVSVLLTISIRFERVLFDEFTKFSDKFLSSI